MAPRRGPDCPQFTAPVAAIAPAPGEIWKVNFPETCAARHELWGVRRCVVIGSGGPYGMRLVVLLTGSKPTDGVQLSAAVLHPSAANGLEKPSTAWAWNARTCDLARFAGNQAIGKVTEEELKAVRMAVRVMVG